MSQACTLVAAARLAHGQARGDAERSHGIPLPLNTLEQHLHRLVTRFVQWNMDRGERRDLRHGFGPVVEPDDGHILRDLQPGFVERLHGPKRRFIVACQDGRELDTRSQDLLHGGITIRNSMLAVCNQIFGHTQAIFLKR